MDRQLHVALISLTAEMPYTVVFNARKRCGLDAWRRLCHVYEPHNARRNMRLLRRILVQPRATLEQLRAAMDKWEADLVEYVQRGNRDLDDPQKVTILLSMVPEQLEDHLEMNIGRLDTYAKARAEVISYTEQKAAKIDEGKGGKGKEKPHNPDKDVVCHLCKKKGHRKSACWYASKNGGTGGTLQRGTYRRAKELGRRSQASSSARGPAYCHKRGSVRPFGRDAPVSCEQARRPAEGPREYDS